MTEQVSREELRKKLRNKIKEKRSTDGDSLSNMSRTLKKDPQSALMSLGLDDAEVLKNAKNIVKNPKDYLKNILTNECTEKNEVIHEKPINEEDDDEEDVPPNLL